MTQERKRDLVFFNPAAVVCDPDKAGAAVFDLNGDHICSGIQRIFHQLLDHGGWSFDHFSSRDLVNRLLCEQFNFRHHFFLLLPAVFYFML